MSRLVVRTGFGVAFLLVLGCRAQQLCQDQDRIRCCLLDLYTNQILDNLIRAYEGLPIVQLDYTNITGTITQDASGNLTGSRQEAAGVVSRAFSVMAGGMQSQQLSVTANPVLNNNEVYNAYLEFAQDRDRFVVTNSPPPPGAAHLVRRHNKTYYWVPAGARADFLKLALVTTVLRGQPLSVPEDFEVTVVGLVAQKHIGPKQQQHRLTLQFREELPNDSGILKGVVVDGVVYSFELEFYRGEIKGEKAKYGKPTDRLDLVYSEEDTPVSPQQLVKALTGQKVHIELQHFHPKIPSTDDLLRSLQNEVQGIRFNQLRKG
jgi:hypothetical protein